VLGKYLPLGRRGSAFLIATVDKFASLPFVDKVDVSVPTSTNVFDLLPAVTACQSSRTAHV
jgi:hypothetical protein